MADTLRYFSYRTPFGSITIAAHDDAVTQVALGQVDLDGEYRPTEITNACANQLQQYFSGKRSAFSVPFSPAGTDFQKTVWETIGSIPYGQTRTPKEVAELIGNPESYRSVAKAAHDNPLVVLIPAHRVVPASGIESPGRSADLRKAFRELEQRYS